MVQIKGTGFSDIDSSDKKTAKVYYGGAEAEKLRNLKKDLNKFLKDFGGDPASDKFNPKGTGMGDRFDPTATNYFSPGGGAFQETKVASTDLSGIDFGAKDFAQNFAKGINTDSSEEKKNFFDGSKLADNTYKSTFESDVSPDYSDTYKDTLNILKKDEGDDYKSTYEQAQSVANDLTGGKYNIKDSPYTGLLNAPASFYDSKSIESLKTDFTNEKGEISNPNLGIKKEMTTKNYVADDPGIGYREGDHLSINAYKKNLMGGKFTGIGVQINPLKGFDLSNKTGLGIGDKGFTSYAQKAVFDGGSMYSSDPVTQAYKNSMLFNRKELANAVTYNQLEREQNPQNFNKDGSRKTLEQKYGATLEARDDAANEFAKNAGYESFAAYKESREEFNNKISSQFDNSDQTELNKKLKVEVKQPNVLDRTMNFIGNVTNKVLGIQDAGASQLGPINVKTVGTENESSNPTSDIRGSIAKTFEGKTLGINKPTADGGFRSASTVPSGSFGISEAGRTQAAINRGISAATATGIPSGSALAPGSFGISPEGRRQAAMNRAQSSKNFGNRNLGVTSRSIKSSTPVGQASQFVGSGQGLAQSFTGGRGGGNTGGTGTTQRSGFTRQGKPQTKAQKMATKNISRHGGTASAAAANKASMRAKAKARHKASQARKKAKKSKKK